MIPIGSILNQQALDFGLGFNHPGQSTVSIPPEWSPTNPYGGAKAYAERRQTGGYV
jgi:hypothetical protein